MRQRGRKRKAFADESTENDTVLTGSDQFKVECYTVIIDRLLSCLAKRTDAYRELNGLFGVLFDTDIDSDSVRKRAAALSSTYPDDLDNSFSDELLQFKNFLREEATRSPEEMLQIIRKNGIQTTFPGVFVALRLFLTLAVTNCEGERSFSQLKRVKNELRTTMGHKRLSALSLMAIESEQVKQMDFEDLLNDFASRKVRKKL